MPPTRIRGPDSGNRFAAVYAHRFESKVVTRPCFALQASTLQAITFELSDVDRSQFNASNSHLSHFIQHGSIPHSSTYRTSISHTLVSHAPNSHVASLSDKLNRVVFILFHCNATRIVPLIAHVRALLDRTHSSSCSLCSGPHIARVPPVNV